MENENKKMKKIENFKFLISVKDIYDKIPLFARTEGVLKILTEIIKNDYFVIIKSGKVYYKKKGKEQ